jgi:probable F420-dependent oxidoreductase
MARATDDKPEVALFPPYRSGSTADPVWLRDWAVAADELGFDAIVLPEHTVVASGYARLYPYTVDGVAPIDVETAFPDPMQCLSFVASCTRAVRLGTAVLVLPNHHPVMLAKQVATLDRLSNGRVELSVGAGWMREEIEAFGVPFERRGRYMDESIDLMRALWQAPADGVSCDGEFHRMSRVHCRPTPVQATIPLHAGGHSPAAARRAGARCEGFHPLGVSVDRLGPLLDVARNAAVDVGRDPEALKVTFGMGTVDDLRSVDAAVSEAQSVGAHRVQLAAVEANEASIERALGRVADHLGLVGRTAL